MSSLVIRNHSAKIRVAAESDAGPGPHGLDEVCSTLLKAALSSMSLGEGDGVWLIRQLHVESSAMAHWSPEQMATQLANRVTAAVKDTVAKGPNGVDVLWFPARAAVIARLLIEVAEGSAKQAWYFSEFSKLMDQGCGGLLLELCRREPQTVRDAICYLLPTEERLLLKHVSASEAGQILRVLAQSESSPSRAALTFTVAAFEQIVQAGRVEDSPEALALHLYFAALRSEPAAGGSALAQASLSVATLAAALRLASGDSAATQAWLAGDWETLKRELGTEGVARLAACEPVPHEIRQRLVETTQAEPPRPARENASTPFGGMFLLLPLLELFEWHAWLDDCPGLEDHEPAQILQLLAVAGGLGARKARRVFEDPVLRRCLGIDPQLTLSEVAEWASIIPALASMPARLAPALERSGSIGSAKRTLAASPNGPMLVDGLKGVWMGRVTGSPLVDIGEDEPAIHLGALLPGSPELVEAILLASQALLRELAWRLPGFASSSIPFLQENFLEFPATVSVEDDRGLVLVDKPPLHIVLALNGMNRKRFQLPFSGGVEWILSPQ